MIVELWYNKHPGMINDINECLEDDTNMDFNSTAHTMSIEILKVSKRDYICQIVNERRGKYCNVKFQ